MQTYDLGVIQSNIDQMLLRALEGHEKAIEAYGLAIDEYSGAFANYRRAKAEAVKSLKSEGKPVTIITDLANGMVAGEKATLLKSEGYMKKCKMLVEGYIERIQGIKFLGNRMQQS